MGAGMQQIIRAGGRGNDNEAEVSDQALHVKVIGGGGSGPTSDVNIASVGGNPVTTTVPVSGTVSVTEPVSVDDNGGSLTIDGTVAVSSVGGTVTIAEPVSVDDNGGSLTVDGTVTATTPEAESAAVPIGHTVFPAGVVVDSTLSSIGASDGEWSNLRVDGAGALWATINSGNVTVENTAPTRFISTLHNAQVFNNVTTTANGSTVDLVANQARYLLVYYDIAVANTPTSIRLVPQFSPDSGTTWFDYSVDQWVEMRFVPGQMPLKECCPLNYVVGTLFRVRIDAVGTTAANTFTVTLKVESID